MSELHLSKRTSMVTFNFRLPEDRKKRIDEIAVREKVNSSDVLRAIIEFFFAQPDTECIQNSIHEGDGENVLGGDAGQS